MNDAPSHGDPAAGDPAPTDSQIDDSFRGSIKEVLRIAIPLMISTGTFSLVLFADRTFLLSYDGASMSASMASGTLFWVMVCLPVGIASMTGAIISQYIGAGQSHRVGRFLWQSVWLSLAFLPLFAAVAYHAPWLLRATGQPDELVSLESTYLRLLLIGAVGNVLETALSGFFSGTERTSVIMWVSIASGLINVVLDIVLIFGFGPDPVFGIQLLPMGIAGAAIGSVIAFWFKVVVYVAMLLRPTHQTRYRLIAGFGIDWPMIRNLIYFGLPTGLMYLTEAGGFTVMVLRIGTLGDIPLRATTMAINFNMVAFIPLVGVSIAASVLMGRHLIESGPARAVRSVYASLTIGLIYSGIWMVGYLAIPDVMMSLYEKSVGDSSSIEAIRLGRGLLKYVAIYVVFDSVQLILAGALRGAGDTWFVLIGGVGASLLAIAIGFTWEPDQNGLSWWWTIIAVWIWMLATTMTLRFAYGKWKTMRMV
ncbi:MATE family efflux transporter [Rubripirellula reticaptiva]|uniref:Multidrug-efflux transporter n=1 Tax=Rubripirellula reticaptiva TaxID=2528013 RepID=A0A5C6FE65_9BACT|nr:MATE family efflux transporter [Rubripirellula reticaptiva]TWU57919.1 Multidrug resistance protein MdtK [Rubripirellula reticaptiva]